MVAILDRQTPVEVRAPVVKPALVPLPGKPVVLETRRLSATYTGELAIEDVSFAVRQGERIALVGPNGAGKSTLLKAIVGLLKPVSGQVLIHNDPSRQAARRVAYVPQFGEVDWNFPVSVWDAVMMGRVRHIGWFRLPIPGGAHHRIVREALDRVGLLKYADRQIGELSGGQKRRVFIARALAQEADILLLDEPFAGVDPRAQEALIRVLNKLQADGVTIVLATHDLMLASTQFDRLLLMHKSVVAFGKANEVFKPDLLAQTYGGQLALWQNGSQVMAVADQHL
ncbi:MAG: metal ABC transporter ATP-binding protein [Anaerolineae bacterium]|nr:metal ABC transporter ATP-binding protein [Anaerolineae bacterium]